MESKGRLRSILFWIFPYGTRSWRKNPWFTLWVFTMHFGLLFTPIFLLGHNILLKEKWGISLWTLPEAVADGFTVIVIVSVVFLILRRIALPEVRIITNWYDYLLLLIAVSPFISGFLAYHSVPDYYFCADGTYYLRSYLFNCHTAYQTFAFFAFLYDPGPARHGLRY